MGLKGSGLLFGEFNSPERLRVCKTETLGFLVPVSPGKEWRRSLVTRVAMGCGIYLLFCHDLGQILLRDEILGFQKLPSLNLMGVRSE